MKVRLSIAALLSILVLVLIGCGNEEPKEANPTPAEFKTRKAIQTLDSLNSQQAAMNSQISKMETQLQNLVDMQSKVTQALQETKASLSSTRAQYDQVQVKITELRNIYGELQELEQIDAVAQKAAKAQNDGGWPIFIKILIVIAILVVLIVLLKKMTQSEEFDDDDLLDEEFLEENDLGTVRYPSDAENSTESSENNEENSDENSEKENPDNA